MAQQLEGQPLDGTTDEAENSFMNWLEDNNVKPDTINKLITEYNSMFVSYTNIHKLH